MTTGKRIGLTPHVFKQTQEGKKKSIMGFMFIPFCQGIIECSFSLADNTGKHFQKLVKNRFEQVVRRAMIDLKKDLLPGVIWLVTIHRLIFRNQSNIVAP